MADMLIPSFTGLGGKFSFPRSYVRGFGISYPGGATASWDGESLVLSLGAAWGYAQRHIKFTDAFAAWSSNHYTIDHIFAEAWDNYPGGPHLAPPPYNISLKRKPGQTYKYLFFTAPLFDTDYFFELPPCPTAYWTPNI